MIRYLIHRVIEIKSQKISNSVFLSPCTPQEVFDLIKKLKDRKACRTIDIETRFIKLANPVISNFLTNLFNIQYA